MRTAITVVRFHDGTSKMVAGPEVPIDEQKRQIKQVAAGGKTHPKIAEIQFRVDVTKRIKFSKPQPKPAAPVPPTDPVPPVDPVSPVEPTKPAEPAQPVEPQKKIEPAAKSRKSK